MYRRALNLIEGSRISIQKVAGENRNSVFRVSYPLDAFVKIYNDSSSSEVSKIESLALRSLSGLSVPTPAVIAAGFDPEHGVRYLITEPAEGHQLDAYLENSHDAGTEILDDLLEVLAQVSQLTTANCPSLPLASKGAMGPYSPQYSELAWICEREDHWSRLFMGVKEPGKSAVLGSLSMNNIIVDPASNRLSAPIDLEGFRLGTHGFDHAMLWYDLLANGFVELADYWLSSLSRRESADLFSGTLVCAAWISCFRCLSNQPDAASAWALLPQARKRIMAQMSAHLAV